MQLLRECRKRRGLRTESGGDHSDSGKRQTTSKGGCGGVMSDAEINESVASHSEPHWAKLSLGVGIIKILKT